MLQMLGWQRAVNTWNSFITIVLTSYVPHRNCDTRVYFLGTDSWALGSNLSGIDNIALVLLFWVFLPAWMLGWLSARGQSILGIALTIAGNAERLVLTKTTIIIWHPTTTIKNNIITIINNNNNINMLLTRSREREKMIFLTWNAGMLVLPWCRPGPLSTPVKSGSATITTIKQRWCCCWYWGWYWYLWCC